MPLLSLRACAKHRGVSLAAVQKAIHSWRVTPNADGLIDSDRAAEDSHKPELGAPLECPSGIYR
jgi:hypothetical protein